jgi:hypothetical protein
MRNDFFFIPGANVHQATKRSVQKAINIKIIQNDEENYKV